MTMHASVDGAMNDDLVMYLGARAAGCFGLVFPEQIAIVPEGRTTVGCVGIWSAARLLLDAVAGGRDPGAQQRLSARA